MNLRRMQITDFAYVTCGTSRKLQAATTPKGLFAKQNVLTALKKLVE